MSAERHAICAGVIEARAAADADGIGRGAGEVEGEEEVEEGEEEEADAFLAAETTAMAAAKRAGS